MVTDSEYETALREIAALRAEREEMVSALEMMWDKYENGTACYENPDEYEGFVGNAVHMSHEEENSVLALIPSIISKAAAEGEK